LTVSMKSSCSIRQKICSRVGEQDNVKYKDNLREFDLLEEIYTKYCLYLQCKWQLKSCQTLPYLVYRFELPRVRVELEQIGLISDGLDNTSRHLGETLNQSFDVVQTTA